MKLVAFPGSSIGIDLAQKPSVTVFSICGLSPDGSHMKFIDILDLDDVARLDIEGRIRTRHVSANRFSQKRGRL